MIGIKVASVLILWLIIIAIVYAIVYTLEKIEFVFKLICRKKKIVR